jgi:hypothetical protein
MRDGCADALAGCVAKAQRALKRLLRAWGGVLGHGRSGHARNCPGMEVCDGSAPGMRARCHLVLWGWGGRPGLIASHVAGSVQVRWQHQGRFLRPLRGRCCPVPRQRRLQSLVRCLSIGPADWLFLSGVVCRQSSVFSCLTLTPLLSVAGSTHAPGARCHLALR